MFTSQERSTIRRSYIGCPFVRRDQIPSNLILPQMKSLIPLLGLLFLVELGSGATKEEERKAKEAEVELLKWVAPSDISKEFPYYLTGYSMSDKGPIWVVEYGKWPNRKFAERGEETRKLVLKHIDQMLTRWAKSCEEVSTKEYPVTQYHYIADVDGYQMSEVTHLPTAQFIIREAIIFAKYALPGAKTITVINANQAFELLFTILKPALGPVGERMELHGTSGSKWKPRLQKLYGKEALQTWHGGTAEKVVKVYG